MSAVVLVLCAFQTANHLWTDLDFWVWLGPVRAFAARPLDPGHPLLAGDAGDPYLGPWSWVVGTGSRLTGVSPFAAVAGVGLVHAVLLLAGLRALTRRVTDAPWAPVLMLAFTLTAWGFGPWRGSGYPNLNSLGTALPLGSMFAVALGSFGLAWWWDWCARDRPRDLGAASAAFVVVLLTHQITGLWVALVAVGILVGVTPAWTRRRTVALGVAAVAAGAVLAAWPFFGFFAMVRGAADYDWINPWAYRQLPLRVLLALPAVPILIGRWRRSRRDPLVVAEVLLVVVLVAGWVGDRITLGRLVPGAMLVAHLAMADWFARRCTVATGRDRTWARIGVVGIVVVGAVGSVGGLARMIPRPLMPGTVEERLGRPIDRWRGFADLLRADDVVVTPDAPAAAIGGLAARTYGIWIPAPFVDDAAQRLRAQRAILDPSTPTARRRALLRRSGATVLVTPADDRRVLDDLADVAVAEGWRDLGTVAGHRVTRLR